MSEIFPLCNPLLQPLKEHDVINVTQCKTDGAHSKKLWVACMTIHKSTVAIAFFPWPFETMHVFANKTMHFLNRFLHFIIIYNYYQRCQDHESPASPFVQHGQTSSVAHKVLSTSVPGRGDRSLRTLGPDPLFAAFHGITCFSWTSMVFFSPWVI